MSGWSSGWFQTRQWHVLVLHQNAQGLSWTPFQKISEQSPLSVCRGKRSDCSAKAAETHCCRLPHQVQIEKNISRLGWVSCILYFFLIGFCVFCISSYSNAFSSSSKDSLFLISLPTPTLYTLNYTQVSSHCHWKFLTWNKMALIHQAMRCAPSCA